jgi:hypothetical protein
MLDLVGLGILAGVVPVYLGIAVALVLRRALPRTWEAGLIGLSTGVLTYLFFDLMHEAVELMGARDPLSWLLFLGSLFLSFVGLVHLENINSSKDGTPARHWHFRLSSRRAWVFMTWVGPVRFSVCEAG